GPAEEARTLYLDMTPAPVPNKEAGITPQRDPGSGRPTKKGASPDRPALRPGISRSCLLKRNRLEIRFACADLRRGLSLASHWQRRYLPAWIAKYGTSRSRPMTYVVTDNCIKCKYMDCVEVC